MTPTMMARAALTAAALLLGLPSSFARVVHVTVETRGYGAIPADLHVGDVIEWDNQDIVDHTATALDHSFDTVLPAGEVARTALRKAGRIRITCRYHPGMSTMLIVQN